MSLSVYRAKSPPDIQLPNLGCVSGSADSCRIQTLNRLCHMFQERISHFIELSSKEIIEQGKTAQ